MQIRILAILLISAVLIRPAISVYLIVDYELNKDYISLFLCENRDRPELNCNGKCYLMSKLQNNAEEKRDEKSRQISEVSKIEVMIVAEILDLTFRNTVSEDMSSPESVFISGEFEQGVFKPPIA